MKTVNSIFIFLTAVLLFVSCSNDESKEESSTNDTIAKEETAEAEPVGKVEKASLVYFHYTKRCATCNAITNVSKEIAESFAEKASFTEYNLDEKEGEEMGEKLKADGQTYLIVYGDKQIDLTDEAFLHAKSNPDKFKTILKEKLDKVLL